MTHARSISCVALAATAAAAVPDTALAHAFGARYDLPLPLWLYLTGAGAAVALTFLLLGLFARKTAAVQRFRGTEVRILTQLFANRAVRAALQAASLALFTFILLTGALGAQDPIHNLAPTLVWVIWWVGFAFVVMLLGNSWPALNPWTITHDRVTSLLPQNRRGRDEKGWFRYPDALGAWPAVLLFAGFAWIELVSEAGERPRALVCLIVAYSLLTWAGMAAFGRQRWLNAGEIFHLAFSVFGRFAPLGVHDARALARLPGEALIQRVPVSPSMMVFVILMLSTVTFDGFVETPAWAGLLDRVSQDMTLRPALLSAQSAGIDLLAGVKTLALLTFPALFTAVYLAFCAASRAMAGGDVSVFQLAGTLVLSLVPIAIGYHLAHYLSYLLLAGQLIIPLASDPFGWGWDLFGTAGYAINIGIINAEAVWYLAIVAIVCGHAIAVWIAHVSALAMFGDAGRALRSQIPMLVLMVLYTMISLWILSQPIVET